MYWKILEKKGFFCIFNPTEDIICAQFPFTNNEDVQGYIERDKAYDLALEVCELLNNQRKGNIVPYEDYIALKARYEEIYKLLGYIER